MVNVEVDVVAKALVEQVRKAGGGMEKVKLRTSYCAV